MSEHYHALAALLLAALAPPAACLAAPSGPTHSSPATDLALQATAANGDAGHGWILYLKHCVECHGPHAWGDAPRVIPAIAGQQQRYIIVQLARFATGERQGSDIHGSAMHDTLQPADVDRPQALADLAAWLTHAAPNPHPQQGEGKELGPGGRKYAEECSGCHGSDGGGGAGGTAPALAGQHYGYLLEQLESFTVGQRVHGAFAASSPALSAQQQQAVADYLSRLTWPGVGR